MLEFYKSAQSSVNLFMALSFSLMLRAATTTSKTRQTLEDERCNLLFVCSAQAKVFFLSRLEKIGECQGFPYLRQCAYGEMLHWFELVDLRLPLTRLVRLQQHQPQ